MKYRVFILAAIAVAAFLAFVVAPYASSKPDGLERVAQDRGFLDKGEGAPAWRHAPAPDYAAPGVKNDGLATSVAGLAGVVITFGAASLLGYVATRNRRQTEASREP